MMELPSNVEAKRQWNSTFKMLRKKLLRVSQTQFNTHSALLPLPQNKNTKVTVKDEN